MKFAFLVSYDGKKFFFLSYMVRYVLPPDNNFGLECFTTTLMNAHQSSSVLMLLLYVSCKYLKFLVYKKLRAGDHNFHSFPNVLSSSGCRFKKNTHHRWSSYFCFRLRLRGVLEDMYEI